MHSSEIIKLAPTLSAEERYKLAISDFHKVLAGEKPILSEAECQAIRHFDNRAIWEEYTHSVCMLQWADTLWSKDIDTEKLRVFACYLLLSHATEKVLIDCDDRSISEERRTRQLEDLKRYAAMLGEHSAEFYVYPEAIKKIKQELYDVSLFNDKKMKRIANYYEMADDLLEDYNEKIRAICRNKILKKYFKPIVQNMESYIVKKPIPDPAIIEQMVDDIRQIADSETRMLGR